MVVVVVELVAVARHSIIRPIIINNIGYLSLFGLMKLSH